MANTKAYRHPTAKRRNLPTHETATLMDGTDTAPVHHRPETRPGTGEVRLHWGRDEAALEAKTLATPLFIQEKIHPGAFANSLMQDEDNRQRGLFEEFNNLPEGAAYKWYEYDGNWSNRLIRGPSVEVMASLLAKEDMAGKVQMVYFDPPYGINYKANVQVRTDKRRDADGIPLDEGQITAFCDTYKSGIHSYLDTIHRVAVYARELLADSGSLFLQIGAENVHRLAIVLDEVFGAENRVATIMFKKSGATSANTLPEVGDFLLWYAKDRSRVKFRQLYEPLTRQQKVEHMGWDAMLELADGTKRQLTKDDREDPDRHLPQDARLYRRMRLASGGISKDRSGPFVWEGTEYPCPPGEHWRVSPEGMLRLAELGRLDAASGRGWLGWKRYEEEVPGRQINNFWDATMSPSELHYVVETAESVIERCVLMATDPGDLVFDPTCGSGTTAYVAEQWGRRWITVDTGTLAVTLARQRLACAVFDYYLLLDSPDGAKEEARRSGKPYQIQSYNEDPSAGFVYERCRTVSARILAYDLDEPPTLLVNQPVRKSGVKRVSAAFTVESHAPFKVLNPELDSLGDAELSANVERNVVAALEGAIMAINGNTDSLEDVQPNPYSHAKLVTHIARHGERDVGVAVVPPEVPVGSHLIDRAAVELGKQTLEINVLCIVAFSYDSEQMGTGGEERRGRIQVLKFQAEQNLRIGELDRSRSTADKTAGLQLLGEPEVHLLQVDSENDQYIVEITGFTTYDPATGATRPGSNREIACWMLDTDHDSLQFRVDRLHFPNGADDKQIVRYRKALGRHVAPDRWASVLSCRSAPFPRPKTGTIAVRLVTTACLELFCQRSIDGSA